MVAEMPKVVMHLEQPSMDFCVLNNMSFIPNTTPTPNWLYNGEMKKMTDTELRVVLLVTRHTLGWIENKETGMRKQEDWISHSQLVEKSGKSSRAISNAVAGCVEHGWIETRDKDGNLLKTSNDRRRRRVYYRLGSIFTDKLKSTADSTVDENLPQITTKSTADNDINLPQIVRNTKETLTKENNTNIPDKSGSVKNNKRKEIIRLAELFDKMVYDYLGAKIITPKRTAYFIILNAMNTHKIKPKGILAIYKDWFNNTAVKDANKVKLSWCLGKDNINSFKVKNK